MSEKQEEKPEVQVEKRVNFPDEEEEEKKDQSHIQLVQEKDYVQDIQLQMSNSSNKEDEKKEEDESVKDEEYYQKVQKERVEEELKELGRDMWFTKLIVQKTWLILTLSLSFIFVMTTLCIVLGGFELTDNHERDYLVWDDKLVKEWDMLELGRERVQTNYPNGIQPLRITTINDWTTSITFECTNCTTILTADYVKEMYAIEQLVIQHSEYSNFCEATSSSDSSCNPDAYTSFSKSFGLSINTLTQAQVDAKLTTISTNDATYQENNIFLETSFTQSNLVSKKARALFIFASPIEIDGKRYETYLDDEVKQREKFVDFSDKLEGVVKSFDTNLKVEFYNVDWYDDQIDGYVMGDFGLATLSFVFVLIYVSFHLRSVFLASAAMLAIAFSYPIAIVINRFIFQVDFFQSLNFVAVFVILGISADNVFVFTDSWQQSGQHEILNKDAFDRHSNFQPRMNYTWRVATKAITTTSFTTTIAFLATGFSQIMPISAFGYFASVLVVVNYCFAIVTFPACLILFERYLVHRCRYRKFIGDQITKCFSKKTKTQKISSTTQIKASKPSDEESQYKNRQETQENIRTPEEPLSARSPRNLQEQPSPAQNSIQENPEKEAQKPDQSQTVSSERFIEKFFRVYWNNWMNKAKIFILIFVIIWCGLAIWRISEFEPAKEALQMLPDDHWLNKIQDGVRNDYHTGEDDNTIQVSFVWGIKGISKKGVGTWEADNRGTVVWDDDFDMSSTANQQRIVDICDYLMTNSLVKDQKVTCWVKDFLAARNGGTPVAQANFYTELDAYLASAGQSQYTDSQIGYIDGRLYFMRIMALAVDKPFQGYDTLHPVYKEWEALKDTYNSGSGAGVNNAFQTGEVHWAFLISQKEFTDGAIEGTLLSLTFAFIVLLISTLNIITALYAITSITCIVISVIALMEVVGWTLGVIESVAIVILIGFSVDYAVHLANHYVESVYEDRFRRMEEALSSMGISIFSGAITTIGSGLALFFATLLFFQKFALLIVSTIFFSLFFSLVFFTALNHLIGPQKNFGNLKFYVVDPATKWIKKQIRKCFHKKDGEETEKKDKKNKKKSKESV